jgi:hypothetical protein
MGSFGEQASFFGLFACRELVNARIEEIAAERGDVFGTFRPGECARTRDFFLNARRRAGSDAEKRDEMSVAVAGG